MMCHVAQVKIIRTNPFFYGTVRRFLLYGDHQDDVFATGGDVELAQVSKHTLTFNIQRYVSHCMRRLCDVVVRL